MSSTTTLINRNVKRRFLTVGISLVGLIALSGCFKMDMAFEIEADDTVNGTMIMAFDEEMYELMDEEDKKDAFDVDDLPEGATAEEYKEDGMIGQKVTLKSTPLAEFPDMLDTESDAEGEEFSLTHENGKYSFSMTTTDSVLGDAASEGSTGDSSDAEFEKSMEQMTKMMLKDAEFKVSITFPGEVEETNGKVSGKTVTWDVDMTKPLNLTATAAEASTADKAKDAVSDTAGSPLFLIIGGIVVVVLLALGGFYLVRRSSKASTGDS